MSELHEQPTQYDVAHFERLAALTLPEWADEVLRQQNHGFANDAETITAVWPDESGAMTVLEKGIEEDGTTYYKLATNVGEKWKPGAYFRHWAESGTTEVCSPSWKTASIREHSEGLHTLMFATLRTAPYVPETKFCKANIDAVFAQLMAAGMQGTELDTAPENAAAERTSRLAQFRAWLRKNFWETCDLDEQH